MLGSMIVIFSVFSIIMVTIGFYSIQGNSSIVTTIFTAETLYSINIPVASIHLALYMLSILCSIDDAELLFLQFHYF